MHLTKPFRLRSQQRTNSSFSKVPHEWLNINFEIDIEEPDRWKPLQRKEENWMIWNDNTKLEYPNAHVAVYTKKKY